MTTEFGLQIIDEAQRWLAMQCVESGGDTNKLYCKNSQYPDKRIVWQAMNGKVSAEPYCAAFVSEVLQGACEKVGKTNKIKLTRSANDYLNTKVVRVDKVPVPGCVYYKYTFKNGKRTGQHVGVVVQLDPDGTIWTIDGNTLKDNIHGIAIKSISEGAYKNAQMHYRFVHTEEMHPDLVAAAAPPVLLEKTNDTDRDTDEFGNAIKLVITKDGASESENITVNAGKSGATGKVEAFF